VTEITEVLSTHLAIAHNHAQHVCTMRPHLTDIKLSSQSFAVLAMTASEYLSDGCWVAHWIYINFRLIHYSD